MVLVDSSVWIEYFKGNAKALPVNKLLDNNALCINDLILSELIPSIDHKKEYALCTLLQIIAKIPIVINWENLVSMQIKNIKNGINKVGIPDLILAQNIIDHNVELFTFDKHFELMSKVHGFHLFLP